MYNLALIHQLFLIYIHININFNILTFTFMYIRNFAFIHILCPIIININLNILIFTYKRHPVLLFFPHPFLYQDSFSSASKSTQTVITPTPVSLFLFSITNCIYRILSFHLRLLDFTFSRTLKKRFDERETLKFKCSCKIPLTITYREFRKL